jgi:ferredoxin
LCPRLRTLAHEANRKMLCQSLCVYFKNMADKLSKQPENVPGPWYVDTSCALCRMCLEEAPNLITYNRDETAVHFFKQPETAEEGDAAQRAMEVCPTLAIGNDG